MPPLNILRRLSQDDQQDSRSPLSTTSYRRHRECTSSPQKGDHDPDKTADQALLQAERFRACVEAPKGRNFNFCNYSDMLMPYDYDKLRNKFVRPEGLAPIDSEILFLRNFDQDDEFFHVSSQIEPSLRIKIERGEFVELERLLPKDRVSGGKADDLNKQLFQLITQGTNTYMEPPTSKTGRINSICMGSSL